MNKIKQILAILSLVPTLCQAQSNDENYVQTTTLLDKEGKTSVQSVQYYNGLGYPTVSVATAGGNGETAYSLTTYDALGREECKYLPVANIKNSLLYKTPDDVKLMHSDKTAFALNHYDAMNRVTSVELPGKEWRDADKRNWTEYSANTDADKVLHYVANPNGNYSLVKPDDKSNPYQYYPANTLTKEVNIDADGKRTETFKDLFGNIILQRTVLGDKNNLDTYYVYDAIGQLCYVLSPLYQKNGKKAITAYEYRYDSKGRLTKKFLPGAEYIQYWYDNADRIVAMQDGVMRKNNKYRFTIYDDFGRMVVQGLCSSYYHNEKLNNSCVIAKFDKGNVGFLNTGYVLPEYFQKSLTSPTLEIVNYYDRNQDSIHSNSDKKKYFSDIKINTSVSQVGQLTGTLIAASNGEFTAQLMVYDIKGNLTNARTKELGGRITSNETKYSFTNKVMFSETYIAMSYRGSLIVTENWKYNPCIDKKSSYTLTLNHGDKFTNSVSYNYNKLGQLSFINRPAGTALYTYDIHGWLKTITTNSFKEELFYADWAYPTSTKDATIHKCYNGNIAAIRWSNNNYNQNRGYRFVYDKANRLTDALYGERADLNNKTNRYNEVLEYDENGNITNLQRRGLKQDGEYGKIDNLNLKYNGNQLNSVEEDAKDFDYTGSFEYKKKPGTGYKYNENGSLIADKSRGIAYIRYDFNNNPEMIYFTNGSTTEYVYSASGEKLRVIHNTAKYNVITRTVGTEVKGKLDPNLTQYSDTTDYLLGGSLVMKNGKIDKYLFDGGYAQAEGHYSSGGPKPLGIVEFYDDEGNVIGSTSVTYKSIPKSGYIEKFRFNFYNQDHLGNNREVVDEYGYVSQVTNYYPFGAPYADATAVKDADFQPYKYNGKELDLMHGLNTYDYGARQHDPILARWDRIDPHCESYYNVSPYVYANNNPVMLIDIDGKDWYSSLDSVGCKNGQTIWRTQIHYTACTSQEQMSKNNINGTYMGKTVVLFDGYYDEKLGKGGIIDGPGSKHATATVYGANGPDDITSYTAFTMSSNFEKYGAIQDGVYNVSWREYGGDGSISKNYMLENRKPINTIDGNRYADGYSKYQKDGIFIHRTNWNGNAGDGKKPVSLGCLLINGQQWADFEKHVGRKPFKVILRRQ